MNRFEETYQDKLITELNEEIARLRAQLVQAKDALKFYALDYSLTEDDRNVARRLLKEFEGNK